MPSNKPVFTLRTDKVNLDKLHRISEQESRSDNKQLEYILLQYIRAYEAEHGAIEIDE